SHACNKDNAMQTRAYLAAFLGLSFLVPAAPVTAQSAGTAPRLQLAQADRKAEDEAERKDRRGPSRDGARSRGPDRGADRSKDADNARREAMDKAKAAREAETRSRAEAEAKAKAARDAAAKAKAEQETK